MHTIRLLLPAGLLLPLLISLLVLTPTRAGMTRTRLPPVPVAHATAVQLGNQSMGSIGMDDSSSGWQQRFRSELAQVPSNVVTQQVATYHLARLDRSVALTQAVGGAYPWVDEGVTQVNMAPATHARAAPPQRKRIDPVAVWMAGLGGVALVLLAIVGLILGIFLPKSRDQSTRRHPRPHNLDAD